MNKKAWIIFAAVCVVLIGGLVYLSSKNKVDVSNVDAGAVQAASQDSGDIADHTFGKADSKVVLIEYGDFQCPGCEKAYLPVKEIKEKYKDQIAFVFRNYPLVTIHPNAKAAAAAAEAAGLQGKYWEMHDKLYEGQNSWQGLDAKARVGFFASYAEELGLDATKFKEDLENLSVTKKISFDQALGKKANVTQTPTFILNGKNISNDILNENKSFDPTKLEEAVKAAMREHDIELPKDEK